MTAQPALRAMLGGTFDPVHTGHLRLALEVADALGCERVHLIPSAQPPHRPTPAVSAAQRLALLECALGGDARLVADRRELDRTGPSYTVDTLRALRAEHPGVHWCLIVGADALATLPAWNRWHELLELAHLVVAARPGAALRVHGELAQVLRGRTVRTVGALRRRAAGAVLRVPVPRLDISATRIRAALATGRNVRHLLPDACLNYIHTHGLYGSGGCA